MNNFKAHKRSTSITPFMAARQSGFSLIELMVAVALSLLLMMAILQLFLDVIRTQDEMSKTNAQMENGRFAMQVIADDVMHGGFWDGYVPQFDDLTLPVTDAPTDYPAAAPAPCEAYPWGADAAAIDTYKKALLAIPVQVYDAVPPGCSAVVANKKAGTDVLVVRHADAKAYAASCDGASPTGSCAGYVDSKVYFQSSRCSGVSPYAFVLGTSGFNLQKMTCLASALMDVRRYAATIYYVRDYSVTTGDGVPTLMRAEFGGDGATGWTVEPIIEGIENLVVELGIDSLSDSGAAVGLTTAINWANPLNKTSPTNRGDGAPDGAFVHCTACSVAQLVNTVAVKVYVLARNVEPTRGYTDAKAYQLGSVTIAAVNDPFKRHVYSTTVRLTNVSMRRETP
jgi:type IV pilus assembly protein PilW